MLLCLRSPVGNLTRSGRPKPRSDWIAVSIPLIIEADVFAAVEND
jgi:hypothetical protein